MQALFLGLLPIRLGQSHIGAQKGVDQVIAQQVDYSIAEHSPSILGGGDSFADADDVVTINPFFYSGINVFLMVHPISF